MKSRLLVGFFLVVASFSVPTSASASLFDDLAIGDFVTIKFLFAPDAFRVTEIQKPGDVDPLADFVTYCVDAGVPIAEGTFEVVGGNASIQEETAYLYDRFRQGLFDPTFNPNDPLPLDPPRPAGLQEAIDFWEGQLNTPGKYTLGPGIYNPLAQRADCAVNGFIAPAFNSDGTFDAAAAALLCNAIYPGVSKTWSGIGSIAELELAFFNDDEFNDGDQAQPLLVRLPPGDCPLCRDTNIPVPEPGSMLLLGSGLVGLANIARRRMKKRG